MAISKVDCLKIETAGLLIGWTYFLFFAIGFLAILTASLVGIYLYIAGEDSEN
jgi:nitrate reductase NapE component